MAISKRLRFEVFKRDDFTCRYCGRKSPEAILEIDHVTPRNDGVNDDEMNLVTSCFECNRGKGARNLSEIITGEDPHDKAIELLERERQLAEYNHAREEIERRVDSDIKFLSKEHGLDFSAPECKGLRSAVRKYSRFDVSEAIGLAIDRVGNQIHKFVPYTYAILKNWSGERNTQAGAYRNAKN